MSEAVQPYNWSEDGLGNYALAGRRPVSPAWMPLYIADYLKDTVHLSAAEHGAYMLLIMRYWQDGGLPQDEKMIARFSRLSHEEWTESRDVLASLFGPEWSHPRIDEELAKASAIIDKRRLAAEKMHSKRTAKKDACASACAEQKHCDGNDTRVPYLSPTPREEEHYEANASSSGKPDLAAEMVEIYHEVGAGVWPKVQKFTPDRRAAALRTLKKCPDGIEGWRGALIRARASPHLTGSNDRGWTADFDFLTKPKPFTRLIEGCYDARHGNYQRQSRPASGADNALAALDQLLGGGGGGGGGAPIAPGYDDAERDAEGVYRIPH